MTLERAVRELASIVLEMRWQAFGGEQWLGREQAKARAILIAFPDNEPADIEKIRAQISDRANYTAGLGLTEHCQDGNQAAYRECLAILDRLEAKKEDK